jgi:hypothetical protein
MGSMTFSSEDVFEQLAKADLPDSVLEKILNEQAKTVADAQRQNAITLLNEKGLSTGATARSIKIKPAKRRGAGMQSEIVFEGTRPDGKKAAEVAFLNEYGSSRNSARHFIAKAIDSTSDKCVKIAEDALAEWQDK